MQRKVLDGLIKFASITVICQYNCAYRIFIHNLPPFLFRLSTARLSRCIQYDDGSVTLGTAVSCTCDRQPMQVKRIVGAIIVVSGYVAVVAPATDRNATYISWGHTMIADPW